MNIVDVEMGEVVGIVVAVMVDEQGVVGVVGAAEMLNAKFEAIVDMPGHRLVGVLIPQD